MRLRLGLAALAAFALYGCSEPVRLPADPPITVHLSSDDPDGNAPAIAAFVRRTCLDASADPGDFELAVQGSGWDVERTRIADARNPVSAWRLGRGRLFHSLVEVGEDLRVVDCHVELDGSVAPSVERMRAALRPLVRHGSLREVRGAPQEVKWHWRPGPNEERELTIGALAESRRANAPPGRRGISIHFATTPASPRPSAGRG